MYSLRGRQSPGLVGLGITGDWEVIVIDPIVDLRVVFVFFVGDAVALVVGDETVASGVLVNLQSAQSLQSLGSMIEDPLYFIKQYPFVGHVIVLVTVGVLGHSGTMPGA